MRISSIVIICFFCVFAHYNAKAQTNYRIKTLNFKGNDYLTTEQLKDQLNTTSRKKLDKLLFWKKNPVFVLNILTDDISRLKNYYIRNGFLQPEITYKLDTTQRKSKSLITININIEEKDFVIIDSINICGLLNESTKKIIDSTKNNLELKKDSRFIDKDILGAENSILQNLLNVGYPLATIQKEIKLDKNRGKALINFNVNPGHRCYFGNIRVSGNRLIPEKFIRKQILFSKSNIYNQLLINKTQQNIYDTDLFQYVIINALKDSIKENYVPIEISVKEHPRWSFEGGIGYGTEDRVRLSGQVSKLSFLGGARRLVLNAKTSYFVPLNIDIKFIQPNLLLNHLDFSLNPFFIREREQSYQIDRIGGGLNFLYHFSKRTKFNLTYAFEHDRLNEINDLQLDSEELIHNKSIVSLGGLYNATNNRFYPSKGVIIDGSISYSGLGFGYDMHYYQIQSSLRQYISLSNHLILALKLKSGVIQNVFNSPETPLEERFYAGGAISLRGWERHKISPVNQDGFAIGGNTLLETSTEIRFPIYDIFGGVIFFDAGNVWPLSYQANLSSLHYNTGIGFRIKSPIGPIRLDMASPIIKDSFDFQFFISIGQTF
ncbi:outer membrane protein assembly factor BamA [Plebeiibacterium marinum]|uniref:Outer membrane protein assembly factor BamA n=1 Tax=Plebeiibacterium marinum TaxID=2992111 RepID=A0AAE3SK15_9BACT|nr:outer membrane protein assembly factor BamA [Plebeiobacterium marinum]MCW3806152.1 outer membrane protein assembly factor BamA [Plebeiobacterium marinum]